MQFAETILDLVGNTPLVRLSRVTRDLGPADRQPLVLAKLEMLNPGGSVKDRIGLPMIETFYGKEFLGLGILIDQVGSYFVLSTLGILVASIYSSGKAVDAKAVARKIALFVPFHILVGSIGFVLLRLGLMIRMGGFRLIAIIIGVALLLRDAFFIIGRRHVFGRRRRVSGGRAIVFVLHCGKCFGILALDLGNRGVELHDLPLEHFFRRAWLHVFKLAHDGAACLVVHLGPVFGSIVRQAIHGLANDCYKIRHQYFLMIPGKQPGRDSSLIRNSSPQRGRSQV